MAHPHEAEPPSRARRPWNPLNTREPHSHRDAALRGLLYWTWWWPHLVFLIGYGIVFRIGTIWVQTTHTDGPLHAPWPRTMLTVIHVLAGALLLIDLSEAIRRRGLAHAIAFVIALVFVAAMQFFVLGMNAR